MVDRSDGNEQRTQLFFVPWKLANLLSLPSLCVYDGISPLLLSWCPHSSADARNWTTELSGNVSTHSEFMEHISLVRWQVWQSREHLHTPKKKLISRSFQDLIIASISLCQKHMERKSRAFGRRRHCGNTIFMGTLDRRRHGEQSEWNLSYFYPP